MRLLCIIASVCTLCKNRYSSQSNLNRHLSEKHSLPSEVVIYDEHVKSFKCLEGCNLSFHHRSGLLHHLEHIHKISVEQEERQFVSRDGIVLEHLKHLAIL
nr:unnamed protein product [Callosobruchus chinensis]